MLKKTKKVLVIIPTPDRVMPACYEKILSQDYENFSILIYALKPIDFKNNFNKTLNSTRTRNAIRDMALASDADYFMFVDSDTVMPKDTISTLVSNNKDMVGGWYKILTDERWASGYFTTKKGKKHFVNYTSPQKGLIEVDMIGLGCLLVSRKVYKSIKFNAGLDEKTVLKGYPSFIGISGQYGVDAHKKGFKLYMDGRIICQHLIRN